MSILNLHARPIIEFDENNPDHRMWFWNFIQNKTWKNCPVRFETSGSESFLDNITNRLLKYYSKQEFGIM